MVDLLEAANMQPQKGEGRRHRNTSPTVQRIKTHSKSPRVSRRPIQIHQSGSKTKAYYFLKEQRCLQVSVAIRGKLQQFLCSSADRQVYPKLFGQQCCLSESDSQVWSRCCLWEDVHTWLHTCITKCYWLQLSPQRCHRCNSNFKISKVQPRCYLKTVVQMTRIRSLMEKVWTQVLTWLVHPPQNPW